MQEAFRKSAAQFEELARDTEVPQAMRDLAEKNVTQIRETYERSAQLVRTRHARFVRAKPSEMRRIPSNTPRTHAAATGILLQR